MITDAHSKPAQGEGERLARVLARERALAEMTRAVTDVTLPSSELLDVIARCASEQIGDACTLRLLREDGTCFESVSMAHAGDPAWVAAARALPQQRTDAGITGRILRSGETVLLPELNQETVLAWAQPEHHEFLRRWPIYSVVGVPLRAGGKVIGVANLLRTTPGRPYALDDLEFLQEIADRAVMAIVNGRLYEALRLAQEATERTVQERTEALARANEALKAEVAERSAAEAQVRAHERFLDSIIENLPDMVFVKEAETLRFVRFNRAGEELLGYDRADLLGKSDYDFFPRTEADFFTAKDRQVLAGRAVVDIPAEPIHTRVKGERTLHTKKIPVLGPDGVPQYLLGISRDITEHEQLRAALVRSERLASIGLLSAGIAHEINNPTAYVANNLHVLERDVKALMEILAAYESAGGALAQAAPEAAARIAELAEAADLPYIRENIGRVLERTSEGVWRVSRIVESLRNLVRTDRIEFTDADLRTLVAEVLEIVRGRLQRRAIEVVVDCGEAPVVRCVPTMLSQVLLNLLTNAMYAVESNHPADDGWIRVSSQQTDEETIITVSDNGCGIPPESTARLFDPFFTTKPVGEGTGLGLAITHSIVASHGGRLTVKSRVGEGASFQVHLPRKPDGAGG